MFEQITSLTGFSLEAKIAPFCARSGAKITQFLPNSPLFKPSGDLWGDGKKLPDPKCYI